MPTYYGSEQNYAGRIPVIPLPYSENKSAIKREIMIDYSDGNIYVVADDGTIIDITKRMATAIQNINSSNTVITIDGLGDILLKDLLQLLWESNFDIDIKEEVSVYLPTNKQLDFQSIQLKDNYIQLYNYDRADENTIPIKTSEGIVWRKVDLTAQGGIVSNPTQPDNKTIEYHDEMLQLANFDIAPNGTILVKDDNTMYWVDKDVLISGATGGSGMTEEEKTEINNSIQANSDKIEDLNTRVSNCENNIQSDESAIETALKLISDNKNNINTNTSQIKSIRTDIDAMSSSIGTHTDAINNLTQDTQILKDEFNATDTALTQHLELIEEHNGYYFMDIGEQVYADDRKPNILYYKTVSTIQLDIDNNIERPIIGKNIVKNNNNMAVSLTDPVNNAILSDQLQLDPVDSE